MQVVTISSDGSDFGTSLAGLTTAQPDLGIVFGNRGLLEDPAVISALRDAMPGAQVVGCSTAGEINSERTTENALSIMGIKFDATPVKVVTAQIAADKDGSYNAGRTLATDLQASDLRAIMVLSPGLNVNGSALVNGIRDVCDDGTVVFGGLAGDGTAFGITRTLFNGDTFTDKVVAVGFYGTSLQVGTGSRGGWQAFGPVRRVTKAKNNVLEELDGKSALELYKQYLGERADELPASGLLYPFAILSEDQAETGLIRTILDIDEANGSLILAGDLPENALVRLMHADNDALVDGAEEAAEEANSIGGDGQAAAICVSCVGRRIVMGNSVDDEVESVAEVLGVNAPIIGYYSYGEICPFTETGLPELHNQTMTVTLLRER
ncbi:MAG TPA: hypothetical protein DFI00_09870 [Rhodospirillaceae bacterium]|mgnify:FL=1|nr:hypothetical protein [Alphaproteobacteria bacterium]OUT40946.1 MAG: hypothetical protein CBB62_00825 [Micavibrio sp. TMED2]HCI47589.1 hypothetical protein [Rhodospirillaceae bacterium]MAS47569.1 hypothetical protein [Alphaproteobacteria bacterium]MAX96559.1 hypothetical protein [Alphaproteobacteria bacterium]|tara:strand:- start:2814 stop:3953 length:1140 start_codon:yes stop_codon:yes gene_type:complete